MLALGLLAVAPQLQRVREGKRDPAVMHHADHQRSDRPCDRVDEVDRLRHRAERRLGSPMPGALCTCSRRTSCIRLTFGLAAFACSDGPNAIGQPCDSVLWPALLTSGAPIAGPGVNRKLLGTVTRTDILSGESVQQVTYAGLPLYRFFLDETPDETDGANLFDPVTSPAGTWYLVEPGRGHPATGRIQMRVEWSGGEVLAASMDNDFSLLPHGNFPVYTLSNTSSRACQSYCALIWQPVLTSGQPEAGNGVNQHALGVVVRPDGTRQVTYQGKPLYLFIQDAYIPGVSGTKSINGAGAHTPWGVFNTIPLP